MNIPRTKKYLALNFPALTTSSALIFAGQQRRHTFIILFPVATEFNRTSLFSWVPHPRVGKIMANSFPQQIRYSPNSARTFDVPRCEFPDPRPVSPLSLRLLVNKRPACRGRGLQRVAGATAVWAGLACDRFPAHARLDARRTV